MLIVSKNLTTGGIENSFINFVKNVKDDISIETFLCNNNGVLKSKMPQDIKVVEGNQVIKALNGADSLYVGNDKTTKFKRGFRNFVKCVVNKLGLKGILKWWGILTTKKIKETYDCALCYYAQSDMCSKITLKKVNAKQKWAYIHADVSKFEIGKKIEKLLKKYDKILCVSHSCAEIFKKRYADLANKVDYVYNFQNCETIRNLANEFEVEYPETFNIVSVSRLSELEKGIMRSTDVFKQLKEEGYKFNWQVIGGGCDEALIKKYIEDNGMTGCITMHGTKANPYPYIKAADLFYLGSYHESWGIVLIEALALGVPIVTTKTSSSKEILGEKCFICNNDKQSIYEQLKFVLDNKEILKSKKEEIKNYEFDNEANKKRLLEMLKK